MTEGEAMAVGESAAWLSSEATCTCQLRDRTSILIMEAGMAKAVGGEVPDAVEANGIRLAVTGL